MTKRKEMPKTRVTGMTERRTSSGELLGVEMSLEQDPVPVDHITRGYIITGTYTCDTGNVVPSRDLTKAVIDRLIEVDVDPAMIMAYTMPYFVRPEKVSLKDVWLNMHDVDRMYVKQFAPALYTAISFMVGGVEDQ